MVTVTSLYLAMTTGEYSISSACLWLFMICLRSCMCHCCCLVDLINIASCTSLFTMELACAAGGIVWLKFWQRSRDPKKGVGTRRLKYRSWRLRRQISLDWYTIPLATQATMELEKLLVNGKIYRFLSNKCPISIISNVTNNKTELLKTVRLTKTTYCNPVQFSSSLSIWASFCTCCANYSFFLCFAQLFLFHSV